ncbi:hypothetical protein [Corynebacterium lehmanniae]|uniref:Anti-sigma-D factor RsdA sigma factor binding region domain-containing protein n=1 Tax=Corynebacterium lehmanniae TaxID=2913497 RepID=A0ABT4R594_9CORY|nr:hypothetical protein [Corynebacterium lehmanniae]MCZ9290731.1 hypothetical protein [Corynebacterium lehmanniae]
MTRQDDHFEEFANSDAFIEALMLGDDPSVGNDPLAAALLELKGDVDRPMPPAPQLYVEDSQSVGNVASLDEKRAEKAKRRVSPWLSGLIGAAAATVVCVGTGAALFGSGAADEDTTVVELATTLDELEAASENGDEESARVLLEQARGLVATIKEREHRTARGGAAATVTKTVTEATTVPAQDTSSERPTPERAPAVPAPPAQQPTQAPQDPAQRGPGQPPQATQPTQANPSAPSSPQPSTTVGDTAPSQGQGTADESPAAGTGAEQEHPSLRVNDPATMVNPPAEYGAGEGAGVSGGAESGPIVHPPAGSSS